MDVVGWDCDMLCCSAYKFFGPHVGILYAKRKLLETQPAYKLRPCSEALPDRWMTGTQNFAAIAGVGAAIEYIADLGNSDAAAPRRTRLLRAYAQIEAYERTICKRLLDGLAIVEGIKVWGITDPARLAERVATVSFTHARRTVTEIVKHLAANDIFAWHGNYYALPLTETLGLEPEGMVRIGLLHYNTAAEVDQLIRTLGQLR